MIPRLVTDQVVWSDLVVVSTLIIHSRPRVVKAHGPVRIQTLGSEFAIDAFNEGAGVGIAKAISVISGDFEKHGLSVWRFESEISFRALTVFPPTRLRTAFTDRSVTCMCSVRNKLGAA